MVVKLLLTGVMCNNTLLVTSANHLFVLQKLSFHSTASDAVGRSGDIAMAGDAHAECDHTPSNSCLLLESGIPPRPPTPLPPPSRHSAKVLSTSRSR